MRVLLVPAGLGLLLVVGVSGCSSGPACAVDTDCPLGSRCADAGTCHLAGEVRDTGPPATDSGPPRDAPTSDARTDAAPTDAGAPDAPTDAPAGCPATAGSYPLTTIGVMCMGLTATTLTLTEGTPMSCVFSVMLDATDAGTLAVEAALRSDQLGGTLTVGAAPATHCTATFVTATDTVDLVCDDGCRFSAMRAP